MGTTGIEKSYAARVDEIYRLMKLRGLSQTKLATDAEISAKTLTRLLNSNKHRISTYKSIADVLGVTPNTLLVNDSQNEGNSLQKGEAEAKTGQQRNLIEIIVVVKGDFDSFDETAELDKILEAMKSIATTKDTIYVFSIRRGSVNVTLGMTARDVFALKDAFVAGKLRDVGIERVIEGPPLPEPSSGFDARIEDDTFVVQSRGLSISRADGDEFFAIVATSPYNKVLLDLQFTEALDSGFTLGLIKTNNLLKSRRGILKVFNIQPAVLALLKVMGLDRAVPLTQLHS